MRNTFANTSAFWALTFASLTFVALMYGWARNDNRDNLGRPVTERPQIVVVRRLRAYNYVFWQHPYRDENGVAHDGDDECWTASLCPDIADPAGDFQPRVTFHVFNYMKLMDSKYGQCWSLDPDKAEMPTGIHAGYMVERDDDFNPVLWKGELPHTGKCKTQGGE